jgi:hypothetical protein
VSLVLVVSTIAVIVGVCHYLSRVRPVIRTGERSLQQQRELEAWWALGSSEIVVAAGEDESDVDAVA